MECDIRHIWFSATVSYHQADQDTDYLIFSCGTSVGTTTNGESWIGSHTRQCGLFNTSGDTVPGHESSYHVIGSLSGKTHESTGVGNYFLLAGLGSLEDPGSLGRTPPGIYYSGFLNWSIVYPRFGSQYYYYL